MFVNGRGLIGLMAAHMRSDALATVKDLDRRRRGADLHQLAGERIGDAVEVAVKLDVVVKVDARLRPVMKLEAFGRQRHESRPIQLAKQRGARARTLAKRPLVELLQ